MYCMFVCLYLLLNVRIIRIILLVCNCVCVIMYIVALRGS